MNGISGQAHLPLDDESAAALPVKLSRKHEQFCLEYWRTGNKRLAYAKHINPKATPGTVITESCKILKNPHISQRIKELQDSEAAEIRAEVTGFHRQVMAHDVKDAFDEHGNRLLVPKLPDDLRALVSLEARICDGNVVYIPVFASKEKAAAELARLAGLNKEQVRIDVDTTGLNELERAAKLARLLDTARTRRTGSPAAEGVEPVTGTTDSGV